MKRSSTGVLRQTCTYILPGLTSVFRLKKNIGQCGPGLDFSVAQHLSMAESGIQLTEDNPAPVSRKRNIDNE
ncbi:MAG: hypothetical protein IPP49_07640 [Saprospiraceae bacterium]|nr:hypothetical protein [Saprospiraceae bacterium]